MKNLIKNALLLTLVVWSLTSCDNDDDNLEVRNGNVKVVLTDAAFPFDFVTQANVGIAKVELKDQNGEFVTVFEGNANYNMVNLVNGTTVDVQTQAIEAGVYTEARVTLNNASITLSNGNEINANVTAQVRTFPIAPALNVEVNATSEILLDLDINDSFQFFGMGNIPLSGWISSLNLINSCSFQADFRACDFDQTGEIEGTVTVNGTAVENAQVYIDINGQHVYTHSEADGTFTFIGVADGTYTVHASTDVNAEVTVGNITVNGTATANCTIDLN